MKDEIKSPSPPLIEVGCGVMFTPHGPISMQGYVELQKLFSLRGYTQVEEQPPVIVSIEEERQTTQAPPSILQARYWFVNPTSNALVQVQPDRFHRNWRRRENMNSYPGFPDTLKEFISDFSAFRETMSSLNFAVTNPIQMELTYINHLKKGEYWDNLGDLSRVFPFIGKYGDDQELALEGFALGISKKSPPIGGRVHFQGVSAISNIDDSKLLQVSFTARGLGECSTFEQLEGWFLSAREQINTLWRSVLDKELQERSEALK